MSRRLALEGSFAVAEAARMANVDVIAAYPITPQTHIVERLAEMVADGDLDATYVPVESEHSAMSCCLGSAAMGARVFTATASQGLELMHEAVYVASSMRYPIVMAICNRTVSAPIGIWADHSDVMSVRDTGWIQLFCQNNQEAFDMTLLAFRIGEDTDVLFPAMVNLDGFSLTHVVEPVVLPEQDDVDRFLPGRTYRLALDPQKPTTHGALASPDIYTEVRVAQEIAMRNSKQVVHKAFEEFANVFGRRYAPVEPYRADGASTLLLTMGSLSETAKLAVDAQRDKGFQVGLLNLRLWRPFPFSELLESLQGVDTLVVFDRCISSGGPGGPVWSEIRSALYDEPDRPRIVSMIGGLGGRDMRVEDFEYVFRRGEEIAEKGSAEIFEIVNVRGEVSGMKG
jgi:pyruvate ferredoxin oxidoreductase alpha subunit